MTASRHRLAQLNDAAPEDGAVLRRRRECFELWTSTTFRQSIPPPVG